MVSWDSIYCESPFLPQECIMFYFWNTSLRIVVKIIEMIFLYILLAL